MKKICSLLFMIPMLMESQVPQKNASPVKANFYDIQKSFYDVHKSISTKEEKDDDVAKFKRWEWFWESRVNKDGTFPSNSIIWDEWKSYVNTNSQKLAHSTLASSGSWTSLGPSNSESGYTGIGRINCIAFHPTLANTFWVGTPAGGLWKTTNGGSTWSTNTDNLPVLGISDIVVDSNSPNIMYIATGDGDGGALKAVNGNNDITGGDTKSIGILKSTNAGVTWTQTGLSLLVQDQQKIRRLIMHPTNHQLLFAATSIGIYKTTDGGTTWTKVQTGYFYDIEFSPANPSILYASIFDDNTGGQIYVSNDTGVTWNTYSNFSGVTRINIETTADAPTSFWALCVNQQFGFYGIYKSTNGGKNFTLLVDGASSPNLLDATEDGSSTDGQGYYTLSYSISPSDSNTMFVGGVDLWKTIDGGTNWTLCTFWYWYAPTSFVQNVHGDIHELAINPLNNRLYNCNDGGIYYSSNGGFNWTDISNGLVIGQFYRIGTSQSSSGKIIGGLQDNSGKIFSGGQWMHAFDLGDGMDCFIDRTDDNYMYASSYYGTIVRSSDGFATVNNATYISYYASSGWITPFLQSQINPARIFVATYDIYKSDDRGDNWQDVSVGLTNNPFKYLAVSKNETAIYAGGFNEFYASYDSGTTWTDLAYYLPSTLVKYTGVAVHPTNPKEIYITASPFVAGEKVFKSIDGGMNWTNISGSLPNVPVNCITIDQITADIYLGTDVGVFYYNKSLSDWQLYNTGLPVVPVTDIEIQYSSKKLQVATFGRGVWETNAVSSSVGIKNNLSEKSEINIYPNPSNGIVTVELTVIDKDNAIIYDYLGQQVKTVEIKNKRTDINIEALSDGVYYIGFSAEHYSVLHKLVKIANR